MNQKKLNKILIVVIAILSIVIVWQTATAQKRFMYNNCMYDNVFYYDRQDYNERKEYCKIIVDEYVQDLKEARKSD